MADVARPAAKAMIFKMFRMIPRAWWGRAGVSALFRQSGGAVKERGNAAQPFRADVKGRTPHPNRCNSAINARRASGGLKHCSGKDPKSHARINGFRAGGQHGRSPPRLPNPTMTYERFSLDHSRRKLVNLLRISTTENAMNKNQLITDMLKTTWNLINLEDWKEAAIDALSTQHADMVSRSYQLVPEIEQISKNFTNPQKQNVSIEFVYFCETGVRNSLIERSATLERHIKNHASFIYHEVSSKNPNLSNLAIGGRRVVNFIAIVQPVVWKLY